MKAAIIGAAFALIAGASPALAQLYVAASQYDKAEPLFKRAVAILEKHPEMAEVFQLGNRVVWVTPSGAALVIDVGHGKDKLDDKEIEALFVARK